MLLTAHFQFLQKEKHKKTETKHIANYSTIIHCFLKKYMHCDCDHIHISLLHEPC